MTTDDRRPLLLRAGRLPVHPLLVGAFPVVYVWSQNTAETALADVLPAVLRLQLETVAVWLLVFAVLRRDRHASALVATTVVFAWYAFGYLWPETRTGYVVGLLATAALLIGTYGLVARGRPGPQASGIANVAGLVLVLPTLVTAASGTLGTSTAPVLAVAPTPDLVAGPDAPDIYYLIFDRYPRAETLAEVFGHDNRPFLAELEERGLEVLDRSRANYPSTPFSLASSLNLTYLERADWSERGLAEAVALIGDHAVGRGLTEAGYEYVHIGNWWGPSRSAASATDVRTYAYRSELLAEVDDRSLRPVLQGTLRGLGLQWSDRDEYVRAVTLHQLDELEAVARAETTGPRLVFAHVLLPHEPYVFDRDGAHVPSTLSERRGRSESFVRQLEYTNVRILALVDAIVAGPRGDDAIVIIQADEGPYPVRFRTDPAFTWVDASDGELREKFRILHAIRLPGAEGTEIPEDLSPVNTFRYVLGRTFDVDLPLLEDHAFVPGGDGRELDVAPRVDPPADP